MPYSSTGLVAIGGQSKAGNAPQIWAYTTDDAAATVDTTGYFNSVASLLKVGDLIYRVTLSGGNVSTAGWHVVLSNTGSVVDVSDTTVLTVTDAD